MRATSVTIAMTVSDLAAARRWYDALFTTAAALEPVPGIVEYELAGTWIQLVEGAPDPGGWVLRYGVDDLAREHARLSELGIAVGPIEPIPGLISLCHFHDPDGNPLTAYQVLGDSAL